METTAKPSFNAPEIKLHFLDYWRIIRIRKTVILAVFLLVVITATLVTFILPESFASTALIRVERDATDIGFVRDLGANMVIDYRTQRFENEVRDADAVIDLVGGETQSRSFRILRRGGKLISAVSRPDQALAKSHEVDAAFFLVNVTSQDLTQIARLVDGGKLRTNVGAVLPLGDAREAHLMLEGVQPRPKGKIVFDVAAF